MTDLSDAKPKHDAIHREYEVGYGKPPEATRFRKGKSGNPGGRPKGTGKPKGRTAVPPLSEERLKAIILEEAYRTIKVNEGDRQVDIPMAQAIVRSLAVSAARGNQRSQHLFSEMLATTERENKRLHDEWLNTAIQYKVNWERELERRERHGIVAPDPVPHPDDIEIDMSTGRVLIKGPMTKEEKAYLDRVLQRKSEHEKELADLKQMLVDNSDHEHRRFIEDDIRHDEKILELIGQAIPGGES